MAGNQDVLHAVKIARASNGWDWIEEHGDTTQPVAFMSLVKGYHHYNIRPLPLHRWFFMTCVPEPDNERDPYGVKVLAPLLDNLPEPVWDLPTRDDGTATIREIEGSIVGHMPADICRIVHEGLQTGLIARAGCLFTGNIIQLGPVPGGGPALEVMYTLDVQRDQLMAICDPLHQTLGHNAIYL